MTNTPVVTLDVRPDFHIGREPFPAIMRAVAALKPGQKLLLIAPFEPLPLVRVMAGRGFFHNASELPSGGWEVLFEKSEPAPEINAAPGADGLRWIEIDARGLEPPMPMVRILEALEAMPGNTAVIARTDRRPAFLLDELPARGFPAKSTNAPDRAGYCTYIRRATPSSCDIPA